MAPSTTTEQRAADSARRLVRLPTGDLAVHVERARVPLDRLCGFAARRNPRRGFLFVSRVLGRHVPVSPARMRRTHEQLASLVARDLPGPVLFLGMAETAIGLGHGVHEAYQRRTGRADTLFLHSTRYHLRRERVLVFEEEHSHATRHVVYRPEAGEGQSLLGRVRSVVVVDDEASTGRTFANLTAEVVRALPGVERAVLAVITDWCGGERRRRMLRSAPVPTEVASLLSGTYTFSPRPNTHGDDVASAVGNGAPKDDLLRRDHGRLGAAPDPALTRQMALGLFRGRGERLLVLGTGEFVHPPFLLAAELERLGARVRFQATTRSPALVGHALGCALQFRDNYLDGIPNFLYNARRADYDRVLVCHETPAHTLDPALLEALGAAGVAF